MTSHYSYMAQLAAARRARQNAAASPTTFGYSASGVGPGGRTASGVAATTGTGANATAALFGSGLGSRPSYGGNSFTLGLPGGGRAGEPGARYAQAVRQSGDALLAILKGASPTAPYDRALRQSARDAAKAKAEIGATQALFDAYGPAARHDPAPRAARLAAELGVPLGVGGTADRGTPWRRFGMAENPYLLGQLGGLRARTPTLPTMPPYMRAPQTARAGAARSSGGSPVPPSIMLAREGISNAASQPFDVQQWCDAVDFDPTGSGVISSAISSRVGGERFPFP